MRSNPLAGMRGPPRPQPRRRHTLAEVRQILSVAESIVDQTYAHLAADPSARIARQAAFAAERDLLLVRLAADSGARLGELAVLRRSDLDGRVLTIERGLSQGMLGPTKFSRARRLTLGATTAALVDSHVALAGSRLPRPGRLAVRADSGARQVHDRRGAVTQVPPSR